jgi:hypothetical protein
VNSSIFTALNLGYESRAINEKKKIRVGRMVGGILAFPLAVGLCALLQQIIYAPFGASIAISWVVYGGLLYLLFPVKSKKILILMLLVWILPPLILTGEVIVLFFLFIDYWREPLFFIVAILPAAILVYPVIRLCKILKNRR